MSDTLALPEELLWKNLVNGVTGVHKRILLIGGFGYIGSYLNAALIADGYQVDICDCGYRGCVDGQRVEYNYYYQSMYEDDLAAYDTVLFFAGVSNVPDAENDPLRALAENCTDLCELRWRLPEHTRLIYASSGSLYSLPPDSPAGSYPTTLDENAAIGPGINAYDRSKACFDAINIGFLDNTLGLRLGTVCGWSPNLRPELVFNSMCLSAINEGVVRIANPLAFRSILFLDDLYQVVKACIGAPKVPKILNVASFNVAIRSLGWMIAKHFNAKEVELPSSPAYSFKMDTSSMEELLDTELSHEHKQKSIPTQCDIFAKHIKDAK